MRTKHLIFVLSVLFTQSVFADDMMMSSDSKPCAAIAKACIKAGYSKHEGGNKRFWMDCMKPIILGQTVKGADIDPDTVKSCRSDKIEKLKKELEEFQSVSS